MLRELFTNDRRTHALLEALPGISTKTLTVRLRESEKHGWVDQRVYPEVPPHVEYALTDKSASACNGSSTATDGFPLARSASLCVP